jgi:O-acetylserine/cysteine efflux transporter
MTKRDRVLTTFLILFWGTNFTVTKIGIVSVPPMLLASLRYIMVSIPAIFFIRRPKVGFLIATGYALTIGVGQYACLYYALHIGMPAGLSSVLIQFSAFLTIILSSIFFGEKIRLRQLYGLVIAMVGLILIGIASLFSQTGGVSIYAIVLIIIAACFWSISSLIVKSAAKRAATKGEKIDMFGLVVWSALVPPVPMLLLGLTMNTSSELLTAVKNINLNSVLSILFIAWCTTIYGAGIWNYLLSKYEINKVAPLSLLVPVIGLIVAQIILNEKLNLLQWSGSIIILIGLMITNINFNNIGLFLTNRKCSNKKGRY